MTDIANALLPILGIILLGFALKRVRFLPEEAWAGMERLTYYILFPALLVSTLGRQDPGGTPWPAMLAVIAASLAIAAIALVVWQMWRRPFEPATFTSVFQGGVRFNTYIALALAQAFHGAEGLALGAVAAGFMIVLINLMCISAFALWGDRKSRGMGPFLREVLGNPLIIACALGWLLGLSGIGLPGVGGDLLDIIGRAALPFGLLAVGAALRPDALHGHVGPIALSSAVQFALKPLSIALALPLVGLDGAAAAVLVIAFMTPTAPSGYILARQLGGDTETMASIITFQTLLAFLAMPLIALLMLP